MSDNQYVVFKTNTLLDYRAITTFGLNAKPNTKSPIGFFGTGLKMAIAVLSRENIPIRLFIGDTEYEFYLKDSDFRGVEYQQVMMRKKGILKKHWFKTELPFTTQLAKNWTLWQAFRELESNTRDENGSTAPFDEILTLYPEAGYTTIIVGPSEEFAKVYEERDNIFLPEALKTWEYGNESIQVFREPSNVIYYRGIRIMDLDKVSMFTYNILAPIELTEDRTAKYVWGVKSKIQDWLAKQEDKSLVNRLLNATDKHFESTLDWDDTFSSEPSAVFKDCLAQRLATNKSAAPIHPRFVSYHRSYTPPAPTYPLADRLESWYNKLDVSLSSEDIQEFMDICQELKQRQI